MEIAIFTDKDKVPKNISKEATLNKKATDLLLKFIYREIVNTDMEEEEKLRLTSSLLISCTLTAFHNNKAMKIMKELAFSEDEKKEDAKYHLNHIICSFIDGLALALTTFYEGSGSCVKH